MKAAAYIAENKEKMIADIMELVRIPSIFDEETACAGKPFGREIAKALDAFLSKAESMGIKTKNYDGYAGEITAGSGDKIIGILGHMDVVAAGEGWENAPFEPEIKDGKIYGRGAMDDKGPMVAALYAMKYIEEEGLLPAGTALRMIAGTDEEENWNCIDYYCKTAERMPDYSIVPDGSFPMINCEKGLLDIDFSYPCPTDEANSVQVEKLYGGSAKNVVPSKAYCTLKCRDEALAEAIKKNFAAMENLTAECRGTAVEIMAQGKGTHAMSPEKGFNAVSLLMAALEMLAKTMNLAAELEPVYGVYNRYIGMAYNGENFGCDFEDEVSGKLTFNVGTLELSEERIDFGVSVRYPATLAKKTVTDALSATCEEGGIEMKITSAMPSLYVDKDSEFIGVLLDAYRTCSGDCETEPISLGGATYARTIPNAVAFGPLFPYEEELAHEPNEFLSIESLEKMTLIYIEALKGLIAMVNRK